MPGSREPNALRCIRGPSHTHSGFILDRLEVILDRPTDRPTDCTHAYIHTHILAQDVIPRLTCEREREEGKGEGAELWLTTKSSIFERE